MGERSFSDVVAEAKQSGFTEPDPRDDLSGNDVARKVSLPPTAALPLFFSSVQFLRALHH